MVGIKTVAACKEPEVWEEIKTLLRRTKHRQPGMEEVMARRRLLKLLSVEFAVSQKNSKCQ